MCAVLGGNYELIITNYETGVRRSPYGGVFYEFVTVYVAELIHAKAQRLRGFI